MSAADVEALKVDDGSGLKQKVHAQDSLEGEAVIHGSNLDLERIHLQVAKEKRVKLFGEDELCSADATNPLGS